MFPSWNWPLKTRLDFSCCRTFPSLFPECWCHWQPLGLLNIPCPAVEVSVLLLWVVSTRRKHFRIPHSLMGPKEFSETCLPELQFGMLLARKSPRASIVWLHPPDTSLTTNVGPCKISVFEAAVVFRGGLWNRQLAWGSASAGDPLAFRSSSTTGAWPYLGCTRLEFALRGWSACGDCCPRQIGLGRTGTKGACVLGTPPWLPEPQDIPV